MDAVLLEGPVLAFAFILTRLGGLLLGLPLLASELVPMRMRVALAIVLSLAFTLGAPVVQPQVDSLSALVIGLVGEFLLGLFLGLIVRVALAAAELAGEIMGTQMGFGFSRVVDPTLEEQVGPLTRLVTMLVGVLFFITEGYREVVRCFVATLVTVPPGSARFTTAWAEVLAERGTALFSSGMRIAAPIVIATLGTQLSFGLLGRVAPQLNLWAIGFLVIVGLGLIFTAGFAPSLVKEVQVLLEEGVDQLRTVTARS